MAFEVIRARQSPMHDIRQHSVNWPAILSGTATSLAFGGLFLLLGNGLGVPRLLDGNIGFWSGLYVLVAFLTSYYFGGMMTCRIGNVRLRPVVYGVVTWAVTTVVLIGAGSVFSDTIRQWVLSVNWLGFFGILLGMGSSSIGAMTGAISPIELEELGEIPPREVREASKKAG